MAAATADRVAAYAAELGARLEVERTADQAENARLLATCSPKELQRQGILLTPLNVASVSNTDSPIVAAASDRAASTRPPSSSPPFTSW